MIGTISANGEKSKVDCHAPLNFPIHNTRRSIDLGMSTLTFTICSEYFLKPGQFRQSFV